ncbi:hypothetical protein INN71_00210 [Nocardioides sp. ChNu-153]|uniref:hypothetical protein n=1 Tax=unclassified Nocardioides TaxID=2615069 RepID=UPI002406227C|nr:MULTISPECIES: hypothetical protein [unclassified Nocardioides]MDF9714657.1 hypothetical protein [Nocardioides sp. ChNu-99]MDN7119808.1 hypothetical protein [Nocardioides sp. ChNu-153]
MAGRRSTDGDDPTPIRGVRLGEQDGRRSSTRYGAAVVADSLRGTDPALADEVAAGGDWRREYAGHLARSTALAASADTAVRIARDGLAAAHARAVLVDDAGVEAPLDAWRRTADVAAAPALGTTTVEGTGERLGRVEVPYRGAVLSGAVLLRQLDTWVADGVVEPGFAAAIARVEAHPEWLRLPDHQVVLLGAGAAMGPLPSLVRWGADVVAVDVPTPRVWERIAGLARAGAGRVTAPVREPDDAGAAVVPGVHVAQDLAALRRWLAERHAGGPAPVLGTHLYADGTAHVELTLAADVLAQDVATTTEGVLAYLNTPTDSFLVPEEVVAAARERAGDRAWNGLVHRTAHRASGDRLFRPGYATTYADEQGGRWGLVDTLVDVQGPNYALAKRMQRWRGVVNVADGRPTSSTVAPASWTRSVTKNRVLASVYAGAHRFGVEIFQPETAAALMAAKLVADVHDGPDGSAHPEALFSSTAVHGGLWRQPFEPRSALGVAALVGGPGTLARALPVPRRTGARG